MSRFAQRLHNAVWSYYYFFIIRTTRMKSSFLDLDALVKILFKLKLTSISMTDTFSLNLYQFELYKKI